jgi:hypothetical protein
MSDVLTRHKEIMYSSRTRQNTDAFARAHNMKMRLAEALTRVPSEALRAGEKEFMAECSNAAIVNIVHLIYQHKNYEGHARDYEFSGTSMREHWDSGYEDTLRTLRHPEWLERSAITRGVTVHDLHREDPTEHRVRSRPRVALTSALYDLSGKLPRRLHPIPCALLRIGTPRDVGHNGRAVRSGFKDSGGAL